MIVEDAGRVAQVSEAEISAPAGRAAEAAHLIGSGIVTGGIAVVLTLVAIPVTLGMGLAWGVRSVARRLRSA